MNNIDESIYRGFEPMPVDLHGWNGNHLFFGKIINQVKPKIIVEVGTWKGQSAINMAKKCKALKLETTIYCIDTWLGATEFWCGAKRTRDRDLMQKHGYPQVYYQFLSNVVHCNVKQYIRPLPMPSSIGWRYCKHHRIAPDLIYIDGSHEKGDVIADMNTYWPLLKRGGVMFGDDYHRSWPGVIHDVDRFSRKNNLKKEIHSKQFWSIKKE